MNNPQLRRDIQVVPVTIEGRQMFTFVDPFGLAQRGFAVDAGVIHILQLLDGRHALRDMQMVMMRQQGGSLVPLSEIEAFVDKLDNSLLLESERFFERKQALYAEFALQTDRPASHAGTSYDADPERLKQFIREVEHALPPIEKDYTGAQIAGVLAPHIDIKVAARVYVDLYRRLTKKRYSHAIIFGINHQGAEGLFSVSAKNYTTPLGKLNTDRDFVAELKERVPEGTFASSDFDHKIEHSIEFQTIFLHYFLGDSINIVPILCGGIHEFLFQKTDFLADNRIRGMLSALGDLIDTAGGDVLLVAGVDFSHIGLKFGHSMPAGEILSRALANDRNIIGFLERCDPAGLFANALENQDQYNVCGLPAMLIFSSLLKDCSAELFAHDTYDEQATQSAVTYASMLFSRS